MDEASLEMDDHLELEQRRKSDEEAEALSLRSSGEKNLRRDQEDK